MILADKIINERKKNGWSQEELAEKLSVSRQSVSKWESAQATPDLQKLIKMAEIFGVSTDYLLKDEMEEEAFSGEIKEMADHIPPLRKVSLAEANEYLDTKRKTAGPIANAVSLCILSPIFVILLEALTEGHFVSFDEDFAGGFGIILLLITVAIAVFIFITQGSKLHKFEYLKTEGIDTEYGVDGMVKEKKAANESKYTTLIAVGVILCVLSVLPVVFTGMFDAPDYITEFATCLLLAIVAFSVNLFVRVGSSKSAYAVLLQEGDFTVSEKTASKKYSAFSTCYWSICTILFLVPGFLWNFSWKFTWIVWPIGGILYGAIMAILKSKKDTK